MDPTALWYGRHPAAVLLWPLSQLYCAAVRLRRVAYRRGWLRSERLPVPVVVVGNLTVGGTGKTPVVLKLAELLCERGWSPTILTRGYGGRSAVWPQRVLPDMAARDIGDEPLLLARRGICPVVAGPDRVAAARLALAGGDCDILLADDGLQHYRLGRDLEIVLVDAERGFGNGRCLPAGPLREPVSRLADADLVLFKAETVDSTAGTATAAGTDGAAGTAGTAEIQGVAGMRFRLRPRRLVNLRDPCQQWPLPCPRDPGVAPAAESRAEAGVEAGAEQCMVAGAPPGAEPGSAWGAQTDAWAWSGQRLTAVAGIADPTRFFRLLRALGLRVVERPYPDHYAFAPRDLLNWPEGPVVMTEKDAVKCAAFADARLWFLEVEAQLDAACVARFFAQLPAQPCAASPKVTLAHD